MESKIIRNNELFLLEVDGKTMPMYGYMSYQPEKACYEDFKNAGVHLFFTGVYAGDRGINQNSGIRPFRPGFWNGTIGTTSPPLSGTSVSSSATASPVRITSSRA